MKDLEEKTGGAHWRFAIQKKWLWGLLGLGTAGIVTAGALGLGSFYFIYALPEVTLASLSTPQWQAYNVNLMRFRNADDFAQARHQLETLVTAHPDDPIPHFLLAGLYEATGEQAQARQFYKKTVKLVDRSWYHQAAYRLLKDQSLADLAILYYEGNESKKALASLRQIRQMARVEQPELLLALKDRLEYPDRADFHMLLGKELRHDFKLAKAREELTTAKQLTRNPKLKLMVETYLQSQMPQHIRELSPLARYYSRAAEAHQFSEDNLWQAARYYEKALQENPGFEWGYNELAIIYRELHEPDKAVLNAQRAKSLNPRFFHPHLTLGDLALDEGNYQQAITHFRTAKHLLDRLPENEHQHLKANIENQIGYAYELLEEPKQAVSHYRTALRLADKTNAGDYNAELDYIYAQQALERIASTLDKSAAGSKQTLSVR